MLCRTEKEKSTKLHDRSSGNLHVSLILILFTCVYIFHTRAVSRNMAMWNNNID